LVIRFTVRISYERAGPLAKAYQTSQYVVPRGGNFLGKWRSTFAGSPDGKMNVQISLRSEHPISSDAYRHPCLSGRLNI
jgi:hypothetical protein